MELSLEGLYALINEVKATADQSSVEAKEAKQTASDALTIAQEAAGAKALKAAEAAASLEAKIPEEAFEHEGKKYKFLKPKMRLVGDPKLYTAVEIGATAGDKDGLFAKVLKLEGQQLLIEQF